MIKSGTSVPFHRFLIELSEKYHCKPGDIRFDFVYRNNKAEFNMKPLCYEGRFDRVQSKYDQRGFWMMNIIYIESAEPIIIEKDGLSFRVYPNKIGK